MNPSDYYILYFLRFISPYYILKGTKKGLKMQDCPGCSRFFFEKNVWCNDCFENLHTLGDLSPEIITLYNYHDPIKSCLVLFKAMGYSYHRQALIEILESQRLRWTPLLKWCDVVVPAPSSFKSFLMAKFSVANFMAEHLSNIENKEILSIPMKFSFKKQSDKIRKNVHKELINVCEPSKIFREYERLTPESESVNCKKILLLDDVLTSGETLLSLTKFFRHVQFKVLTLCRARAIDT